MEATAFAVAPFVLLESVALMRCVVMVLVSVAGIFAPAGTVVGLFEGRGLPLEIKQSLERLARCKVLLAQLRRSCRGLAAGGKIAWHPGVLAYGHECQPVGGFAIRACGHTRGKGRSCVSWLASFRFSDGVAGVVSFRKATIEHPGSVVFVVNFQIKLVQQ